MTVLMYYWISAKICHSTGIPQSYSLNIFNIDMTEGAAFTNMD